VFIRVRNTKKVQQDKRLKSAYRVCSYGFTVGLGLKLKDSLCGGVRKTGDKHEVLFSGDS
jgi:hypothetical protein